MLAFVFHLELFSFFLITSWCFPVAFIHDDYCLHFKYMFPFSQFSKYFCLPPENSHAFLTYALNSDWLFLHLSTYSKIPTRTRSQPLPLLHFSSIIIPFFYSHTNHSACVLRQNPNHSVILSLPGSHCDINEPKMPFVFWPLIYSLQ